MQIDVFRGIFAAGAQHVNRRDFVFSAAQLLVNFDFDRQPVAVPARHIRRIEAGHGFGFNDEILQAFIHGMAQVNGAVRVRRTVMQQIDGRAFSRRANLRVQVRLFPAGQPRRLVLRKVSFHRKFGVRQVEGRL